uniref:Tn3 family transposase n=1 Tax=Candidatus Protochlamydia sp. R18 TaxID=1353977 RepID=UPI002100AC49|nr:Tn3 family transposase [Candidatus Protochlamydia sp. R18]
MVKRKQKLPENLALALKPFINIFVRYKYVSTHNPILPFHTKVINSEVRDATYVLDGLLYHESDIRIEEHYIDTSGL